MKRKIAIILTAVMALMCLMPVTAVSAAGNYDYVTDDADMLASDEIIILNTRCMWLSGDGLNAAIVTGSGSGPDAYSSKVGGDGLVFYADAGGQMSLTAYGSAASLFTTDVCNEIAEYASDRLTFSDIYDSCKCAFNNIQSYFYYGILQGSPEFYNYSVIDAADYLTDSEESQVSDRLDSIRSAYGMDVALVIDEDQWGDTCEEAANDTYDYYFYGNGADDSGILLYLSKNPRNYWFVTYGDCKSIVGDRGVEYLKDQVVPYLQNDDYCNAFMAYADAVDYMFSLDAQGTSISDMPKDTGDVLKNVLIGLLIALVISLIIAKSANKGKVNQMNTAREQVDAHGYMKPGSFMLQMNQDVFLYSHVDRVEKPKDNDSDSSSGRSHGGGGGSY